MKALPGAFLAVLMAAAGAQAQTETGAGSGDASGVPTVTIINKAPEAAAAPAAPPQLEVAPAPAAPGVPAAPAAPIAPAAAGAPAAKAQAQEADAVKEAKDAKDVKDAKDAKEAKAEGSAAPAAASEPAPPPEPTLAIDIDLTRQVMKVSEGGKPRYTWPVSSARYGYRTPTGTFRPSWMAKMWYSRQYDDAPMPHAIFFHKGVAIHGSYATRQLGRPASHGCVRLAPANAATLYKLVSRHGKERTEIIVHGTPDHSGARIAGDDRLPRGERLRRGPSYRYLPPGYYSYSYPYAPRGYAAYGPPPGYYYAPRTRRSYGAPRRPPRGLYGSGYPYGYGF